MAIIPASVGYQGEFLGFSIVGTRPSVQTDSDKHGIHLMMQLARFMIYHHQVFTSTLSYLGWNISTSDDTDASTLKEKPTLDRGAWNLYLAAAHEVIRLVRNCSPKHVPYVNPFLASTIWLVTAAYIVARSLDPPLIERRVAESNLDLLQINLNAYVSFWGVSATFQKKLSTLEAKLQGLKIHTPSRQQDTEKPESQSRPAEGELQYGSGNWSQYNIPLGVMEPVNNTNNIIPQRGGWDLGNWGNPSQDIFNTAPEANMAADMDTELWGWRIDELLNYGAIE